MDSLTWFKRGICPGGFSCKCCGAGCDCGCRDDCPRWQAVVRAVDAKDGDA